MKKLVPFIIPTLNDIIVCAILISVLGMGMRMANMDGDLGRHIRIGSDILQSMRISVTDEYSHTMNGKEIVPHEWLADVLFGLVNSIGGLNGVVLFCGLIITATFFILAHQINHSGTLVLMNGAILFLGAAASSLHWLTRPHLMTILFLVIWMTGIRQVLDGQVKKVWWMPILMLVWVNSHGAFVAGFMVLILVILGEFIDLVFFSSDGKVPKRIIYLLVVLFICGLITFINPVGIELWKTSIGYLGNEYLVGHTQEYLSPDFHSISTFPFLILIGLIFSCSAIKKEKAPVRDIFLVTGWLGMALISARNIPLFVVVSLPVLSGWIADVFRANSGGSVSKWLGIETRFRNMQNQFTGGGLPVLLCVATIISLIAGQDLLFSSGNQIHFDPSVFPVQAVDWMEENPVEGNGFNYFTWGGYLLYRDLPDMKVFIDGQTDFYGEELTREYETVLTGSPGWETILNKYSVQWILLPRDVDINQELVERNDWKLIYQDQTAVLYQHE